MRILTVTLLVLTLGLHWAFLQTVAWTGMLVRFAHDGSIRDAIVKTFDGRHPCALCKVVEQGRGEENSQDQQPVKPGSKLDPGTIWQAPRFDFACPPERIPLSHVHAIVRSDEPPTPPPRGACDNRVGA